MNRLSTLIVVMAFVLPAAAQDRPSAKLQPAGSADHIDIAILGGTCPLHIRLHMTVGNKPYADAWRASLERWFRFLDRNDDGILSETELELAPSAAALLQGMRQGNIVYATGLGIPAGNFGEKRSARLEDLVAYYRANGAGPVAVTLSASMGDTVSDLLFGMLDKNKYGKISRAECEDAARLVKQLDADDDETVSLAEFSAAAAVRSFGGGLRPTPPGLTAQHVVLLDQPASRSVLLNRYDRNGDGGLDAKELPLAPRHFARLDVNGDGTIDLQELEGLKNLPPDAEWSAAWPGPAAVGEMMMSKDNAPGHAERLAADDLDLQFIAVPRNPAARMASPAQFLMQTFKAADTANRGFVAVADLNAPQLRFLKQMARILDRDADERITQQEVQELVDLQNAGLDCHFTLSFADQGRALFAALDIDRDGRLSQRELRSAWKRLAALDKNGDDALAPEEISRQCTLVAGPSSQVALVRPGFNQTGIPQPRRYPPGTPNWFVKMDANADGEISPREFLGPTADFTRLDTDRDGFLSHREAMPTNKK